MRILIVDDDTDLTELLRLVFESKGFGVTIAYNGEQTLEILEEELPEVVLLDLMMPGIGGLDVCRQIRSNPRTSNIPIIVLTAKADSESKRELKQAGAVDYLVKPVDTSDLIERMYEVVFQSDMATTNASKVLCR